MAIDFNHEWVQENSPTEFINGRVTDGCTNEEVNDFVEFEGVFLARRWFTDWQYQRDPDLVFAISSSNTQRVLVSAKNYEGFYPLACDIQKTRFFGCVVISPASTAVEICD